MFSLTVMRPDGERLTLTQYRSAYTVKYAGFGPVAAEVATSPLGVTDGDKITHTRRGKRNPVLTVTIGGNVEQNRIRLYSYFTPGHAVQLFYRNGARNVYTEGVVESFVCDQFTAPVRAQISIICPQPYWLSTEEIVHDMSGILNMFSFPFSIPAAGVEFSALDGRGYALVHNEGDEPTGFIATVYARMDVTAPVIYNAVTQEAFRLSGILPKGYTLTINTNNGGKRITITDSSGMAANVLQRKRPGSVWLQLSPGENYIAYSADQGADAMSVKLIYNQLYVGV